MSGRPERLAFSRCRMSRLLLMRRARATKGAEWSSKGVFRASRYCRQFVWEEDTRGISVRRLGRGFFGLFFPRFKARLFYRLSPSPATDAAASGPARIRAPGVTQAQPKQRFGHPTGFR